MANISIESTMKFALFLATVAIVVVYSQAATFNINNKDGGPIWIGIQGNSGKEHLANGGFKLAQGESVSPTSKIIQVFCKSLFCQRRITAADDWGGRFWSRTWCYEDENNHCYTGDCGNKVECQGAGGTPPATLIEFTLQGYGGLDYYDISLVDGYNSMASVSLHRL